MNSPPKKKSKSDIYDTDDKDTVDQQIADNLVKIEENKLKIEELKKLISDLKMKN